MKITVKYKGGYGSGNFHHAGRPGKVGGSAREDGDLVEDNSYEMDDGSKRKADIRGFYPDETRKLLYQYGMFMRKIGLDIKAVNSGSKTTLTVTTADGIRDSIKFTRGVAAEGRKVINFLNSDISDHGYEVIDVSPSDEVVFVFRPIWGHNR